MLSAKTISLLLLCATLAACAQASPTDIRMSLALSAQGKTLLAAGKNAEARDVYSSATSRYDQNARAWNGLGVSNELLGKREAAREAYQKAIDLAPNDMTAANNLAHLYIEQGDPASAVELLDPIVRQKNAPTALKQNYAKASKMVQAKEAPDDEPYADLGSFATEGLAQGHAAAAKALMGNTLNLSFDVVPEVKVEGGTPVFTVRATGASPLSVCQRLNPKTITCIPHGKQ
jgi:tetratricopeptide (TPR) repeat protein